MGIAKSTEITNTEASPPVANSPALVGGKGRVMKGQFELETGDLDNDDEIRLAKIPSNASVTRIAVKNDDLDGDATPTLAANLGVFEAGGTGIKDEDCYASAVTTLQSANVTWQDLENEARDIDECDQAVWQDAGLSKDPGEMLEIGFKLSASAATAAAGTLAYLIEYTIE